MEDLLSGLNDSQLEAVKNIDGPCLVIAGAGSGKTRVLTYRIAYLLSQGVPAYNILALTFTNKAAAEMKERIARLVGEDVARSLNMGTFHSIFAKILRVESVALSGYDSNYTILDTEDVKKQISQIVTSLGLDKDTYKTAKVAGIISKAKNDLIPADMYEISDMCRFDRMNGMPAVATIYKEYVAACRRSNSMDFDDLLLMTNILFRDNPVVLVKYQQLFRYVLVDEYQDTNRCQYQIIKKLAFPENNLCVVGDDAQSIYSFRGAKIENILSFSKDYGNYKMFKLEQNYRSTQTIVNAANSVILKNKRQIPKKTFSEAEEGEKINLVESSTDAEEGFKIASLISELINKGEDYCNCAILYRTNAQSRILEEALNKKRIPCKIVKGTSFFQRKEVKDVLSYVRVVINPHDEIALERIINYPARSIGNTTVEKLSAVAKANNMTVWEVLTQIDRTGSLFTASTKNKIKDFVDLMQSFMADQNDSDAYSLMYRIVEKIGIQDALNKEYAKEEALDRYNNILELLNGAKEFVENEIDPDAIALHNYVEKIALLTDIDEEETDNSNKVLLMTVHAAKGLEFKHCFIVGLEENVFPSMMSSDTQQNIEEERRLFYVALTRAMKTVTVSYAQTRRKWGNLNTSTPSRFLSEIDPAYINGSVRLSSVGAYESNPVGFRGFGQRNSASFSSFGPKTNGFSSFNQKTSSFEKKNTFTNSSNSANVENSHFSSFNTKANEQFAHFNEKKPEPTLINPSNPNEIQVGQRVAHSKFGFGVVKEKMGEDANLAAIITFDNWGEKKLLLKFAKLQIVEN